MISKDHFHLLSFIIVWDTTLGRIIIDGLRKSMLIRVIIVCYDIVPWNLFSSEFAPLLVCYLYILYNSLYDLRTSIRINCVKQALNKAKHILWIAQVCNTPFYRICIKHCHKLLFEKDTESKTKHPKNFPWCRRVYINQNVPNEACNARSILEWSPLIELKTPMENECFKLFSHCRDGFLEMHC